MQQIIHKKLDYNNVLSECNILELSRDLCRKWSLKKDPVAIERQDSCLIIHTVVVTSAAIAVDLHRAVAVSNVQPPVMVAQGPRI